MSDYNKQTNSNAVYKQFFKDNPLIGVYVGTITDNRDLNRTGMLMINIPSLGKTADKAANTFACMWTSPFAGSTNPAAIGKDIESYEDTQKSYGMWMVPPDIGNQVLVTFADGNPKYGYVLSCIYSNKFNHMVPGMGAGKSHSDPSVMLPVAEKNKRDEKLTHNDALRPVHLDLAEAIVKQGLANDPIRGTGTASGRRESPSEVFGILTPGPRDPENPAHRTGGHQFIMDDNINSRQIRLRTAGGQQILLDDTTGIVYIINKSGTAHVELGTNGEINVFSDAGINMRTKGNFNLRADKDVNIEAGRNLNLRATGDRLAGQYVGVPGITAFTGPLGTGGYVNIEAASDLRGLGKENVKFTAGGGNFEVSSAGATKIVSGQDLEGPAGFMVKSRGAIYMDTDLTTSLTSAIGFNAIAAGPAFVNGAVLNLNSAAGTGIGTGAKSAVEAATLILRPVAPLAPARKKDAPAKPAEFDRKGGGKQDSNIFDDAEEKLKNAASNLPDF